LILFIKLDSGFFIKKKILGNMLFLLIRKPLNYIKQGNNL
jgi:hypothetical protein